MPMNTKDWHTKKWFKENFGVDVTKLDIKPKEVKNPHYGSSPPMKLWKEDDILPYKSEDKIKNYRIRSEAGKKAHQTRKNNLTKWFEGIKSSNPRIHQITKMLWEIGEKISELHHEKDECRGDMDDKKVYFDCGVEHCSECKKISEEQERLRQERYNLFEELECLCEKDFRTIQLARKYCRENG